MFTRYRLVCVSLSMFDDLFTRTNIFFFFFYSSMGIADVQLDFDIGYVTGTFHQYRGVRRELLHVCQTVQ